MLKRFHVLNLYMCVFTCAYVLTSLGVPSPAAVDTAVTADRWSQHSPRWSVPGPSVSSAVAVCSAHPDGGRGNSIKISFTHTAKILHPDSP